MSFATLNIGMTALQTQQLALDTTGHNIANATTEGYSRQRVATAANRPQILSNIAKGTGVAVKTVEAATDEFLEQQVRTATHVYGQLSAKESGYRNLEAYFNELTGNDISTSFGEFWDALEDLNNNVEDLSTRANAASVAQTFCDNVQAVREKICSYRYQQNNAIRDAVGTVNELTAQIAAYNAAVVKAECGGATGVRANDLRDQREVLVKQLSEMLDVNVNEERNGSLVVALNGRMLVFENQNFELSTQREERGGIMVDDIVFASDRQLATIEAGTVAGMVAMRDEIAMSYQDDLDQFAGEFLWNFNRVYSQGNGLEAYTDMTAEYRIIDPNVTLDQLQYEFTPVANTFQIKDGSFEIMVFDTESGTEKHLNIDIDLTNIDPDKRTILYSQDAVEVAPGVWEYAQPENSLVRKLQDALDSVAKGTFTVGIDQLNRISISSKSDEVRFAFGEDSSGVLAALGLNTFFTGHDAQTINVSDTAKENPQFFAAATTFVPGDQTNIARLSSLRLSLTMNNGTSSFENYYESVIGRLGIESARVSALYEAQVDIKTSVENQRESLSGVNLDEEMTKMTQYNTAFKAAAQFISVVQEMYDSLLSMV